eukprot:2873355-Rhodomonas_salina.4
MQSVSILGCDAAVNGCGVLLFMDAMLHLAVMNGDAVWVSFGMRSPAVFGGNTDVSGCGRPLRAETARCKPPLLAACLCAAQYGV